MNDLHRPHDKLFKQSLSNIDIAKNFLLTHIPKDILNKFDLNDLTFCPNFYIDPQLEETDSDIVYRSKLLGCDLYLIPEIPSEELLARSIPAIVYDVNHHINKLIINQNNKIKVISLKELEKLPSFNEIIPRIEAFIIDNFQQGKHFLRWTDPLMAWIISTAGHAKPLDDNGYLYLHCEHQVTASPLMPLRILKYQLAIIDYHLQQFPKANKLPIIFPTVIYHGIQKPYPYSLNILDLFVDRNLAEQTLAKPAHLVDITSIPDEEIKQHTVIGLVEFVQKHIFDADLSIFVTDLMDLIAKVNTELNAGKAQIQEKTLYIESVLCYIMKKGNVSDRKQFIEKLKSVSIAEDMMGTLAQYFEEEGIAKGIAIGKAEGKAELAEAEKKLKKEIAISMLQRGMDIRAVSDITNLTIMELSKLNIEVTG